jgi:hypothetical protein
MNEAKIILCMFVAVAGFESVHAEDRHLEQGSAEWVDRVKHCISLTDQKTAAFSAEDWSSLERIAQFEAKECREVLDDEEIASSFEDIAIARSEGGNPGAALKAADDCIRTYYVNAGCHALRAETLFKIGRQNEARAELNVAGKIASTAIANYHEKLDNETEPLDKELYSAKLRELQAVTERITRDKARWLGK